MLDSIKNFIRWLIEEVVAPDPPRGSLVILRQREVIGFVPPDSPYGVPRMHVELDVAIPLLTAHEKAQKVTTRNFMASQNGTPLLALPGQDALTFTSATLTPLQYGDKIDLQMFNVDQAGNISTTALDGSFVVTDQTPPDAPVGAFTVTAREVADPGDTVDPAPVPVPAPVPAPEDTGGSPPSG